jgi:S-adenosylhomocysteine hydrolase
VPEKIDREVALRKLHGMGLSIDVLSEEQKAYLAACE